jgi:hypothetical protein
MDLGVLCSGLASMSVKDFKSSLLLSLLGFKSGNYSLLVVMNLGTPRSGLIPMAGKEFRSSFLSHFRLKSCTVQVIGMLVWRGFVE